MAEIRRTQAQRRAATRAAILTAARELFAEHGYHGCSIGTILIRAESSKGAFYHHFRDKAAVLEALLAEFEEEGVRRAKQWSDGITSPLEIIRVSAHNLLAWCTDPYVRQVVLTDALSVLGFVRWHQIDDRYTLDVLDRLLRRGIEVGDVRPLPSTRMMARLINAAANEAALFVANAADVEKARDEASAGIDHLITSIAGTDPAE
ncbi:TetR/AcrR family transcriptional regulator [Mycolicibacterium tusciae]|uniref:TetR/AcrR family transcriptional regulator n=1 Tax=Mycolicibacterium tusciae TaxID=75922 RepID=UPI00024A3BAA|nr:TetR/AcrR family transcriptional regulator [Mycolicibacterium tusciae]